MDVTRENFRSILPDIEDAINKAKCFAIDCEFTGLSTQTNITHYDSLQDVYEKTVQNSSEFLLIQFGLTTIRISDEDSNKFLYKTYNFYVFPRAWKSSFRCQANSLTFLAEHGFNFKKLFLSGIPFCNRDEEKHYRDRLAEKQKQRVELKSSSPNLKNYVPVPEDEKIKIQTITDIVEEFLTSNEAEKNIADCNAFQRKLIYDMIERQYYDKISASTKTLDNGDKVLVIERKKSETELKEQEEKLRLTELSEVEDIIGISAILQKLSATKKLIVGHNMLLDLFHILRQFFQPLPKHLYEFKDLVHSTFPYLIDTKYMCTHQKFKDHINSSVLLPLSQTFSSPPFTTLNLERESAEHGYDVDEKHDHEAGYDSYLTAVAFLGMTTASNISPEYIFGESTALKDYINRLFLMKIADVGYINLVGDDPNPPRNHVFHVTMPEHWTQNDLVRLFKNYGPIHISWINSSSSFVALHHKENSSCVLKTISGCAGFKIQSYADFRKSLNNAHTHTINRPTKAKKRKRKRSRKSSDDEKNDDKKLKLSNKYEIDKSHKKGFAIDDDWSS